MWELKYLFRSFLNHWIFWPLFSLMVVFALYMFFFTKNGYFAYRYHLQEKKKLKERILELEKQKEELREKLKLLHDDEKALKNLSREFLIFPEKVNILKFRAKEKPLPKERVETREDIPPYVFWEKVYVASTPVILLIIFYLSYRKYKA